MFALFFFTFANALRRIGKGQYPQQPRPTTLGEEIAGALLDFATILWTFALLVL